MGFHQAGFRVIGVDINPQPHYPFEFIQRDVMTIGPRWIWNLKAAAVAASPPCQRFTSLSKSWNGNPDSHPDLIAPTREILQGTGLPWSIENVQGAPLIKPTVLCGSAFGLRVRRHRLIETNFHLESPGCCHSWQDADRRYPRRISKKRGEIYWSGTVPVHGDKQLHPKYLDPSDDEFRICCVAMGIDWMTKSELNEAIPPAYGRHIGNEMMKQIREVP
jgi:DNA (cytosine-5)-methyltransferase 1